jgi:hypothetical protein
MTAVPFDGVTPRDLVHSWVDAFIGPTPRHWPASTWGMPIKHPVAEAPVRGPDPLQPSRSPML